MLAMKALAASGMIRPARVWTSKWRSFISRSRSGTATMPPHCRRLRIASSPQKATPPPALANPTSASMLRLVNAGSQCSCWRLQLMSISWRSVESGLGRARG
ncbi:hypothetical protein D3C72_2211570 [compost metagenome]